MRKFTELIDIEKSIKEISKEKPTSEKKRSPKKVVQKKETAVIEYNPPKLDLEADCLSAKKEALEKIRESITILREIEDNLVLNKILDVSIPSFSELTTALTKAKNSLITAQKIKGPQQEEKPLIPPTKVKKIINRNVTHFRFHKKIERNPKT